MDYRNRATLSAACLAAVIVALSPLRAAVAHPGQSVGVSISITDEEVSYDILISADFLRTLLPPEQLDFKLSREEGRIEFADEQTRQRARAVFEEFFKDKNPVTIDGVVIKGLLKEARFVPAIDPSGMLPASVMPPDLHVVVTYPAKGRPKSVTLVWELYPESATRALYGLGTAVEVLAELDAYDENTVILFTRDEPEYTWHAPGKPVAQRVAPIVAAAEPATLAIPAVTLGLIGAGVIALLWVWLSSRARRARWPVATVSAVLVVVGAFCHNVGVVHAHVPWGQGVKLPNAAQATDIFESLQRNVYRAFDYKTESDIYDVLAQSVDGELLDQVYDEVYQSLILRDQGGAVARVQSVDILDANVVSAGALEGSDAAAFKVHCRWQVRGAVYHWSHVHKRTNEYEALYTVAQREGTWRITAAEVLQQHRVVSADDDPPILPPDRIEDPLP